MPRKVWWRELFQGTEEDPKIMLANLKAIRAMAKDVNSVRADIRDFLVLTRNMPEGTLVELRPDFIRTLPDEQKTRYAGLHLDD